MTSMPDRRSGRGIRWWLPAVSLGVLGIGLLLVAVYSMAEAWATPGYSVIDGYWRGRLPWMGIAEALIVGGANASALIGATIVLWVGGAWRRLLVIPPLLPIALWWFLAIVMSSMRFAPCSPGSPCPTPEPDPWAFAYSTPQMTGLYLIAPSLFIVLLALTASRSRGGEKAE